MSAVPDGYVSGPAAATEATTRALAAMGDASSVVPVEGVSDQIALETLARAIGRGLAAEELIRAVTPAGVVPVIDAGGDRDAFRSWQRQP